MEEAGVKLIAEGIAAYLGDLRSAENATNGFVGATEKGSKRIDAASEVIIGSLRKVGSLAVEAFMEAGRAAADFIGDSVGLAGDFDQGMREFQSVAGRDVDAQGLEDFRDLFLDIGKKLPVSTSDVQQAAIEMVKGGIDPAIVAAGGLEQNIQFAAAAMDGDLVKAAEISSKILGGWTSATDSAADKSAFLTHSTDLLAKAANASSTDVEGLSLGIFNAQGIAKTAGVSFDDLTTTLALLAPRFASSSEAGNSLKNMIARLQPTTKPAIAAMQGLGLYTDEAGSAFYDAQGNFVGFEKAAGLLQNSLKGLTKEQQASLLQTIFGNDAMGSAAALADGGAEGYRAMAEQMEKANGVAATAALVQGSFNTKLDNAKGSIEALQITIGSALLPVLGDLLDNHITPAINAFTEWADGILSADDPLQALIGSIDSVLPGFKEFTSFVEDLSSALMEGDWAGAFDVIAQGLGDLGETIGPPLLEALSSAVDMAWNWIQDQAPKWVDQLAAWGEAFLDWVEPYIPPMLDALGDLVADAWAWVKSEAPKWGQELLAWGQELVDWVGPMIPPALAELGKLGNQFLGWIGEQAQPLLTKFSDWADSFIEWIPGATVTFLAEWPGMLDQFLDWIGTAAGPILKQLGDWAITFVQWIGPAIPPFLLALGGIALALGTFIIETAAVLTKKITESWIPAILGWIATDAIPGLVKALDGFLRVFDGWIKDAQTALANEMLRLGGAIVEGLKDGISNAWGGIKSYLNSLAESLPDWFKDWWGINSPAKEFVPIGSSVTEGLMKGIGDMWPSLTKLVEGLGDDLVDKARSIGESVQGAIADAFGATASIDRQIANNLDKLDDVPEQYRQYTEGALKDAEHAARQFLDPSEGAKFFKMRSEQILEFADLQRQLAETEDKAERDRIQAKMNLINAAQTAEINAFNANLNASQSGVESLMDSIQAFLMTQGEDGKNALPGVLESDVIRQITGWMNQLSQMAAANPYLQAYANPAPATYNQRTYNMPIYTNQTPAALQSSMAIMGSMYP